MPILQRLGFLIPFTVPLVFFLFAKQGVWGAFAVVLVAYLVVPVLDVVLGLYTKNPGDEVLKKLGNNVYFDLLLYLYVPVHIAVIVYGLYLIQDVESIWIWLGIICSAGIITGGLGITVAHELGHRRTRFEQFLAKLLLATVAYMHFFVEHNRGHHFNVATAEDPATARYGESFYHFYPRTLLGSISSAWQIEMQRLREQRLSLFSWRNQMLWAFVIPVLFAGLSYAGFGLQGLLFYLGQAFVAFSLLEAVNYIEHYGLTRKKTASGQYEAVRVIHSWNAAQRMSNWLLFNLQRHSHHHRNAAKKYQVLDHYDEAPQLPYGYATMVLIALCPPLWRRIMHPRLEQWRLDNNRQTGVYQ